MKINKKLLMAALASAVIVSAPQAKSYADTQTDDTQAVTENLIDDQLANAAQPDEQKNSENAQAETEVNADEKQNQQDNSKLQSEKETNSKKSGFGSQALNHPAQATAVSNVGKEGLGVSDKKVEEAVKADAPKAFELKKPTPVGVYDPKSLTDEEIANVKKAVVKANPDVKASSITVSNDGTVKFTDPDGNEQTLAPAETVVKDYSIDESKIKDFNENERYRSTQMEQGNGPAASYNPNDKESEFVDGYRYKTLEPGTESPDKKKWGFEIEIDKEKGQRTYTNIGFTNSGRMTGVLDPGSVSAKSPGDGKPAEGFKGPNYKANTEIVIDRAGRQLNLNANATEEDLKYINNKDNKNTTMAWEGRYKVDNPNGLKATQGDNVTFNFTVNPWPNENDKLNLIKLQGEYKDKVFVQGQKVNTGVKVQNLDENAKKRLVGQVYNPNTGKVVPGAKAYIDENGIVQVEMPQGVINKDGTLNKDSIFYKDNDYKGIQSLDVRFFARPRTEAEFRAVGKEANFGEDKYTSTGAGTKTINHNGEDVKVDLQGIDRYDHYNLIGNLKLNLDDTRYYDQGFEDGNDKDTSKHTSSEVKPGKEFEVNLYVPEDKKDKDLFPNQKTPEQMEKAKNDKQAIGSIDWQFINKINEGKKPEDQWKLEYDESTLPTTFKITPPKSAKAGDFVAVPLTYTYTNGSTDTHWFHFVVQESTYIKPEYDAQVNYPVNEQTSDATVAQDDKRISPNSYSLPDTLETDEAGNKIAKDDKGNKWTVKVDEKTGQVSAKPVDPLAFNGGEKLTVPVVAHYVDEQKPGEDITEEVNAYFVIEERANMTARYNAKAGKSGDKLSSDVILNTEDKYNRRPGKYTLESNTYVDDKGNTWNVSIDEKTGKVTATVPNAEEGKTVDGALLNVPVTAHYYEEDGNLEVGTKKTEAQFVAYGTNGKVEKTVEVPFETKVEKDPKLKKGEIEVITEGKVGSKKVTYTIEDSKIIKEEEQEIEKPQLREIHVGEGVNDGTHKIEEKVEVAFETEIQFDDSLKPGETQEVQKGEAGEKKRDVNLTIEDGQVTKTEVGDFTETKAPKKRIIKVGRNTEGKVEHKEELPFKYKVEEVEDLKKGEYRIVKPGKVGTKTTTWTIKNSKVEGEPTVTEVAAEDALIQVGKGTNDGTHEIVEKKNIDYKTVIEYDENLDAGQQEVVKEGNPGEQERTNTLVIKDGQVTETKEGEFKTTKEATDRVVKIGTKPVTKVVEKSFNTEYVYDENLESGKTEEVTPGKNGKVTITTTYDKEQKKVVTSETEEKGQNRVVKIGGKTNGTHTYTNKKPFEVEIKVNPELKKGEHKVIQKGVEGEEEFTVTIENSKVTKTSEPKETKAPVKEIIEVGSDDFTGTFETKKTKAVEFETEYIVDETLEPGKTVVDKEGKLGEEEITVTHTIVNGKVTKSEESKPVQTKAPEKRIVRVGKKPSEGETTKTIEREIPYETKVIYDENLEAGTQKIEKEGKPGKEEVTITQKIKDSKPVGEATETTKTITEKEDRVVRIGVKPVVKETELGNNTEYKHNPELKAGEIKKIKDGTPGKITITTTFNKETGKIETKVERTEPTKAVYEYGSKTDGKVKVESDLPFEVEIIKDPEMEAGKTETVQEGKLGKKETTITVENSKEVSREEKVITEPVKKIVKVGTKNVCEIPPVKPEDPTKPGKEDPTKPGKEDPTKPGKEDPTKPGKEDPTKPGKEDPTKPGKEDPTKPGKEDPTKPGKEDPTKPGEKDPEDPTKPGEKDSEKPGTPGENKPNEPGTPGKTPEENGKTPENNGKTPENNGKTPDNNRGDTPNKPNETPKTPETTEQGKRKEKADTPNRESANKLPKAGSESEIMMLSMSALMTAAGFIGLKKKRKDR